LVNIHSPITGLVRPLLDRDGWTLDAAGVARRGNRRITFFSRTTPAVKFRTIARQDRNLFCHIAVVVAGTTAEMHRLRSPKLSNRYPRALFTSAEELAGNHAPPATSAASFDAEVLGNTPTKDRSHYRLVFKAPELNALVPPQFFMMDAQPERFPFGARTVGHGPVDWSPRPMLKRPFGICRDFHPHFPADYLKRLALPPTLALALYPPAPDHFDMLYKVLPDGLGTNLMTKLRRGDRVHMLGPLGKPFDVRQLRAAGVEEVHVIGGGVGLAPLITLVEALRFYAFPVKVFVGIATLETLRYRDELAATFGEKPRAAYVYLDDLLAAGVKTDDIFLSCDVTPPAKVRGLPKQNLFHGLVPEQYRQHLRRGALRAPSSDASNGRTQCAPTRTVAITCGPNRMMEVMAGLCHDAGIPLKVLLEKRMGCGFGVCFSCVQKVRRTDGAEDYVRICREGPMFDAKEIVWNTNSKPNLEACGCAARS
jgi:dihydroorotate dehydrogenase electron transfer subunit